MAQPSSRQLGEFLLERKVLSRDVLELALDREEREGVPMAALLLGEGLVGEKDIIAAVAGQVGIPFVDLSVTPVRPDLERFLPEDVARGLNALAVERRDGELLVAMENPSDSEAVATVTAAAGEPVHVAIAVRSELAAEVGRMYGGADPVQGDARTLHLNEMLAKVGERGGSDLHLTVGVPPSIRVDGGIEPLGDFPVMTPSDIRRMLYEILTQKQRERFEEELELDTSHVVPGYGRFRMNVFQQRNSMGAVFRLIPDEIVPLELVTGPTGSGKSTTLASIIDLINTKRNDHIVTVEDPIEFVHTHKRCVVNQREVGEDTKSFARALRSVLRQDPDVVLVGEMRDLDTIATAISAAETGHLVFGTLHTQDAPQAIDRIIDVVPAHHQQQVRVQLAASLMAVSTQQLVPRAGGTGRALACEVMIVTPAIRNLIREGKTHQIYSSLQSGGQYGMRTMDQSLAELVRTGVVDLATALDRCHNESDLQRMVAKV